MPVREEAKVARFEYSGTKNAGSSKRQQKQQQSSASSKVANQSTSSKKDDLTVQENYTAEQLEKLTHQYKENMKLEANSRASTMKSSVNLSAKTQKATQSKSTKVAPSMDESGKKATAPNAPKTLETLVEKRKNLKQKLKRSTEPSAQDLETFKRQALQTSREYNELVKSERSRPRVNLVVVGHVDAGKSTIVGHLLYNLGQVSNKQMHRNEVDSQRSGKASFKYAWALDETDEERARGVTIDIALTKFETPHKDIILLDAPGHVDFIPAVISGAAQADAAILVIDATRGEFEMAFSAGGQTREHTFLIRSLGVKSLVVAVNKMDNVNWDYERFKDIVEQLKPFLKQVGFDPSNDVQFVVCSGLTGENLTERRVDKIRKQSSHPQLESDIKNYKSMPSLLEAIDKMEPPMRMVDKPTRACVTDVFKGMSGGVFLGVKVISGKVEVKQRLILMPPNETCEIKQLEARDGRETQAFAGDILTVVATGVDMDKYYRGCILSDPLIPCNVTNRFQARIVMFQNAGTVLIRGTPIEVHMNGTYECGEVRRLLSLLNKNTGELIQSRPRCIAQNSSALIQLRLSRVVCCELYESNKNLGRFMLRSCGKTIAAGLITKIKSAKVPKRSSKMKSK